MKRQNALIHAAWLLVIICCFLAADFKILAAQPTDPAVEIQSETKVNEAPYRPWKATISRPKEFDWIQFTTGEWLKGKIKALYGYDLEFDSDELGLLELDWEDVENVIGHRIFSVLIEGSGNVKGYLQVSKDKVFVTVGDDTKEFERSKLVSIAAGEPKEIKYWSAKISMGLNIARGNTDQFQWTNISNIKRRTSSTRFNVDWLGNLSEVEGKTTIDNQRLNTFFDVFRSRKHFFRVVFGEFFRDPFSNIDYRITAGTGIGYRFIDTAKTEWEIAGGPAYQTTQFDSTESGTSSRESTPALVVGTHLKRELTSAVDFDFRYTFQVVNEVSGTYTHNLIAKLETEFLSWLDFDVSFVWDRIQDPQADSDGDVPEQDDFFLIFGLGIEF